MKIRLALLTPLIFSAAIFSVVSIAPSFAASDRYRAVEFWNHARRVHHNLSDGLRRR